MRQLNNNELENVSGGSLTSFINDLIKQLSSYSSNSSDTTTEATRPESVPSATPIDGNTVGAGIVAVAGAIGALALGALSFLFS